MVIEQLHKILNWLYDQLLSVPIRVKIIGLMVLPVFIMGLALNYWVKTGLSDWLSYLLADERVKIAMQAGGRSVLLVSILAALGSIFLTLLLMFVLTQPLIELKQTAHAVASGNLKSRARVWANDEIGEMARSVNSMIDHLVTSNEDLRGINRRLEALNRVAMAANLELEIHDILYIILKNTLEIMGMEAGWIYLFDPERQKFHLASWHAVPDEIKNALMENQESTQCICQEYLVSGQLSEAPIIRPCKRLEKFQSTLHDYNHISLKLEAREHKLGVVNFLCGKNYLASKDDLELLTIIGSQISEIVANAWLLLKLSEKEASRQVLLTALVKAQEDERANLARELHDGAGQNLTSLMVRLKMIEKQVDKEGLRNSIQELCTNFSETIEYIRMLSYQLRPIMLEELGLEVALQKLIRDMLGSAGINTKFKCNLDGCKLPFETEITLYRIAQETLTNVIRHSKATAVDMTLTVQPSAISFEINDNGKGFDVDKPQYTDGRQRLGLLSMNERLEIFGGSLDVFSAPGKGTQICARLPLNNEMDIG